MDNTQSRNGDPLFLVLIEQEVLSVLWGYMERNRFTMVEQKHETRAMLYGQIHDTHKVMIQLQKS